MAKDSKQPEGTSPVPSIPIMGTPVFTVPQNTQVKCRCPQCTATLFQGPFTRGEIVDGVFIVLETLFQCVNCHRVLPQSEMSNWVTPAP